jgi:hypothetical protein
MQMGCHSALRWSLNRIRGAPATVTPDLSTSPTGYGVTQRRFPSRGGQRFRVTFPIAGVACLVLVTLAVAPAGASDQDRIRSAVDHLLGSQLASGLLAYDFDFRAGTPSGDNNIVRQTGVVSFLAEYYLDTQDESVRESIERALKAFGELSLPISKGRTQALIEHLTTFTPHLGNRVLQRVLRGSGVLYRDVGPGAVIALDANYSRALTGATALALLAELQYAQAARDDRFASLRSAWLQGLLSLYVPARGFRFSPTLLVSSPFVDGEAWLALAVYNRGYPGNESVQRILPRLDDYVIARYADDVTTGFYQWGTMAAALRFEATADNRFIRFIAEQARKLLASPELKTGQLENDCFLVEGLATAVATLRGRSSDSALLARMQQFIVEEMDKDRELQIPRGAQRLRLANDTYLTSPHLGRFRGAFLEARFKPYTRIDFTGHCLSAMLKLKRSAITPS